MATIKDQVTLRTGVADWLNRSDLTDSQIDDFITIGEARLYEDLRVPPLEVVQSFTVTSTNSSIIIPAGLIEIIELKLREGVEKHGFAFLYQYAMPSKQRAVGIFNGVAHAVPYKRSKRFAAKFKKN